MKRIAFLASMLASIFFLTSATLDAKRRVFRSFRHLERHNQREKWRRERRRRAEERAKKREEAREKHLERKEEYLEKLREIKLDAEKRKLEYNEKLRGKRMENDGVGKGRWLRSRIVKGQLSDAEIKNLGNRIRGFAEIAAAYDPVKPLSYKERRSLKKMLSIAKSDIWNSGGSSVAFKPFLLKKLASKELLGAEAVEIANDFKSMLSFKKSLALGVGGGRKARSRIQRKYNAMLNKYFVKRSSE